MTFSTRGVVDVLDPDVALPQVGQGALAVECRADNAATRTLVAEIDDDDIGRTVRAERAFLATLGGDCTLPAAAHAVLSTGPGPVGPMVIEGMLASLDGATVLRRRLDGDDGEALGERLANELLDAGGDRLLEEARR